MYSKGQIDQIPGNVYQVYAEDSLKMQNNEAPFVGQVCNFRDGRQFVFCRTTVVHTASSVVARETALATPLDNKCTAAAIAATEITINTKASQFFGAAAGVVAENAFQGGFLTINDDTGEGYTYKIKSNTAGTALVSVVFTIWDGLAVAIDATTDVILLANPYNNVVAGTAVLKPIGTCVGPTPSALTTAPYYFWVQTAGLGSCLVSGTGAAIGKPAVATTGAAAKLKAAVTDLEIGVYMATDATAGSSIAVELACRV